MNRAKKAGKKVKFFLIIVFAICLLPFTLSGCAQKSETLTKPLAKKLILKKIKFSIFFAVPYEKAISLNNDRLYMALMKNGYIKFNKKFGYTSFTSLFKPYLFKKADRTYIRMGKFDITHLYKINFISSKKAKILFSFKFIPNKIYNLMIANNIHIKLLKIFHADKLGAIFKNRPFLEWGVDKFVLK